VLLPQVYRRAFWWPSAPSRACFAHNFAAIAPFDDERVAGAALKEGTAGWVCTAVLEDVVFAIVLLVIGGLRDVFFLLGSVDCTSTFGGEEGGVRVEGGAASMKCGSMVGVSSARMHPVRRVSPMGQATALSDYGKPLEAKFGNRRSALGRSQVDCSVL
jgi:hypothetical protein